MVLGLFNKDLPVSEQSATLQISSPNKIAVVIVANGESLNLPIKLQSEQKSRSNPHIPRTNSWSASESYASPADNYGASPTTANEAYRYFVEKVLFHP